MVTKIINRRNKLDYRGHVKIHCLKQRMCVSRGIQNMTVVNAPTCVSI